MTDSSVIRVNEDQVDEYRRVRANCRKEPLKRGRKEGGRCADGDHSSM